MVAVDFTNRCCVCHHAEPTLLQVPWERGQGEWGARCCVSTRALLRSRSGVSSCQCASSSDNVHLPLMEDKMIPQPSAAREEKHLKHAAESNLAPCGLSSVSHYAYIKYYLVTVLYWLMLVEGVHRPLVESKGLGLQRLKTRRKKFPLNSWICCELIERHGGQHSNKTRCVVWCVELTWFLTGEQRVKE